MAGYHQFVPGVQLSGQSQLWLGLDVGTRRIGIALSNALGIAQPLLTLERIQPRRDQRSILRLARRYGCVGIIVGNPLHLSGDRSRQTERVHTFVEQLRSLANEQAAAHLMSRDEPASPLAIHLWDERLSSAEAHAALDETRSDRTRRDRKGRHGIVDQLAAVLILQGWLDAQRGTVTLLPPDA